MASKASLDLIIGLKDEASAKARTLGDVIKTGLGYAFGTLLVDGVKRAANELMSFTRLAGEEELGISRLSAAVKATGADWGTASEAIETYLATEMDRISLDDGVGRDALTRLTTATGDYTTALSILPIAADLARGADIDLATASKLIGNVYEGNMGVLSRYGIVLGEGATATEALAAIQERFGGQAEAYANTLVGQQERLSIAIGNVKETIGGALIPVLTEAATWLGDLAVRYLPDVEAAANSVVGGVSNFVGSLRDLFAGGLDGMVANFLIGNADLLSSWGISIGDVWLAWEGLKTWVSTNLPAIGETISGGLATAKTWIDENWPTAVAAVSGALGTAKTWIDENWPGVRDTIKDRLGEAKTWITENWPGVRDEIKDRLSEAKTWIDTNLPLIRDEIVNKLTEIKTWVDENWPTIKTKIIETLKGVQTESGPILVNIKTAFITENTEMKTWIDTNWPLMRQVVETESGLMYKAIQLFGGLSTTAVASDSGTQYNVFETAWGQMKGIAALYGYGPDSILSHIQFGLALINGDWGLAWSTFKQIVVDTWADILGIFNFDELERRIQQLIDLYNKARDAAADAGGAGGGGGGSGAGGDDGGGSGGSAPPGAVDVGGGEWWDPATGAIGHYARGSSYYPGGVGLVGENGPELVELPTGSRVHSAGETAGMLGGVTHNWGPITINTTETGTNIVDTLRLLSALGSAV